MNEYKVQRSTIPHPATTASRNNLETQHPALFNILATQQQAMADKQTTNRKGGSNTSGMSSSPHRPQTEMIMLTKDFVPGDFDVICQRGKLSKLC